MISFIICTYNGQDRIHTMLSSLLESSRDYEFIIVNDGSTDNTDATVGFFLDRRVRLIQQNNLGLSRSRFVGVKAARYENIIFLDDDDVFDMSLFERYFDFKLFKESDLCVFGFKVFHNSWPKERVFVPDECTTLKYKDSFLNFEPVSYSFVWNKVYKKRILMLIETCSVEFQSPAEDLPMNIFYNKYVENIYFLKKPIYHYYVHENSLSRTYSLEKYKNYLHTLQSFTTDVNKNKVKVLKKSYEARFLNHFSLRRLIYSSIDSLRFAKRRLDTFFFFIKSFHGFFNFQYFKKSIETCDKIGRAHV